MPTDHGLHRLIAFRDAVVAIASTLLVLPLADAASKEHQGGLGLLFRENRAELLSIARGCWVVVPWPDLRVEEGRNDASVTPALILAVLMGVAPVVACAVPAIGLWALRVLVLAGPLERLAANRHRVVEGPPGPTG